MRLRGAPSPSSKSLRTHGQCGELAWCMCGDADPASMRAVAGFSALPHSPHVRRKVSRQRQVEQPPGGASNVCLPSLETGPPPIFRWSQVLKFFPEACFCVRRVRKCGEINRNPASMRAAGHLAMCGESAEKVRKCGDRKTIEGGGLDRELLKTQAPIRSPPGHPVRPGRMRWPIRLHADFAAQIIPRWHAHSRATETTTN